MASWRVIACRLGCALRRAGIAGLIDGNHGIIARLVAPWSGIDEFIDRRRADADIVLFSCVQIRTTNG